MKSAGAVFLAAILFLSGAVFAAEDEPVVDGKPLADWLKQLRGENRGLQMRAARVLINAPEAARPKIIEAVLPVLKSDRENDKFVAAQILGEYGPPARAAVPDLLPMLEGTQFERNRSAAAKALGQILKDAPPAEEIEKVAKALIAVFRDKYPDVQRESVYACGMIGPAAKACLPHLQESLTYGIHFSSEDTPYRAVRSATAWTLGRMGPAAAGYMDLLLSRLGDVPEVVAAISKIGATQENVIPNLVDYAEALGQDWRDATPSKEAVWNALESFGPKAAPAVPVIIRWLWGEGVNRFTTPDAYLRWFRILKNNAAVAGTACPKLKKIVEMNYTPDGWDWGEKTAAVRKAAAETLAVLEGKKEGGAKP
jgi:hypothetical protein